MFLLPPPPISITLQLQPLHDTHDLMPRTQQGHCPRKRSITAKHNAINPSYSSSSSSAMNMSDN
ncbi:hypothetical protein K457DRAFT_26159 [Linnemannia elongata AG-77]|uniref:Uncharacterized protein n=1 Tax=Linnemannia elongata AG-77 TaxID=1314771 RepID=A0A197JCZ6_9FUNG|nr:hypothetical protein K457DRAFT_26159 [Linnemannia elongata AG-77]